MCVAWAPNGRTLASAGRDNTAQLWDPRTNKLLGEVRYSLLQLQMHDVQLLHHLGQAWEQVSVHCIAVRDLCVH